jgi:hypothetical protein
MSHLDLSRLSNFGCSARAEPVIPGAHYAQYGQNHAFFVHCMDTMRRHLDILTSNPLKGTIVSRLSVRIAPGAFFIGESGT